MRGSIRSVVGFLIVLGSAGGIDTAADSDLLTLLVVAVIGMGFMISGIRAMNHE